MDREGKTDEPADIWYHWARYDGCWGGELSTCGCVLNAMMLIFEQQQQQVDKNMG